MFKNRLALVTGASSGLGADFARQLAKAGADVILVARRRPSLEKLAAEIGPQARVYACDLSSAQEREQMMAAFPDLDILVNNAGLGVYGSFAEADWSQLDSMLEVDIRALTHLTHLVLPVMKKRGWGRILQVASTASFQPCPSYAAYAAAKSYVLNFSLALDHELKGSGVRCSTLCPGVTATEFFQVSGQHLTPFQRRSMMKSPEVAAIGLQALEKGQPYIVAGLLNTMLALSSRMSPLGWATAIAGYLMKAPKTK